MRLIRARRGLVGLDVPELWRYRELFGFLVWRDILIRYKQTYLGVAWAVIQPLMFMVVFTCVGRAAKFPTYGAPYPLITLTGPAAMAVFLDGAYRQQQLAAGFLEHDLEGLFPAPHRPGERGTERDGGFRGQFRRFSS